MTQNVIRPTVSPTSRCHYYSMQYLFVFIYYPQHILVSEFIRSTDLFHFFHIKSTPSVLEFTHHSADTTCQVDLFNEKLLRNMEQNLTVVYANNAANQQRETRIWPTVTNNAGNWKKVWSQVTRTQDRSRGKNYTDVYKKSTCVYCLQLTQQIRRHGSRGSREPYDQLVQSDGDW